MSFGSTKIGGAKYGNQLVYRAGPIIPTIEFSAVPSSSGGTSSVTNASKAYTDENSTTYANPRLQSAGTANSWYFKFNTSQIPQGATIKSVSCKVKANLTGTSNVSPRTIAMFNGETQKGSAKTLTASAKVFTFSGVEWTREELSDVRVVVKATVTSGSQPWLYFYGATLTVEYKYAE